MRGIALLIIDVQNDFCLGGSLEVPKSNEIIQPINEAMDKYDMVVATKDWHPENHCSFVENGGAWPKHCVKGTKGAELHPDLNTEGIDYIFTKGFNPKVDSYSAFLENDKETTTGVGEFLKAKGIYKVHVVGLALDYCVKFTALDAMNEHDMSVSILSELTRAVETNKTEEILNQLNEDGILIYKR